MPRRDARARVLFSAGRLVSVKRQSSEANSVLAAGVLAVIVLAVFVRLQGSGPQSAVRRYLAGLAERNMAEVNSAMVGPEASPASQTLHRQVAYFLDRSDRVAVRDVERADRVALLHIMFANARGGAAVVPVVAVKAPERNRWFIDAEQTLARWPASPLG